MTEIIKMPEQMLTMEDFQKQIGSMIVQMMMMNKVIEQLKLENTQLHIKLNEFEPESKNGSK